MLVHRFLASSDAEEAQYYSEYHRARDVILALHETCYPSIPNTKRLRRSCIVWRMLRRTHTEHTMQSHQQVSTLSLARRNVCLTGPPFIGPVIDFLGDDMHLASRRIAYTNAKEDVHHHQLWEGMYVHSCTCVDVWRIPFPAS